MRDFVEAARSWAQAMRGGLENRDTASIGDLVAAYDALERRGRTLARELQDSLSAGSSHREGATPVDRAEFLAALGDLYRAAHVCAALSESEALYLRWGQTTARPTLAYSPKGEPETGTPTSTHWEG